MQNITITLHGADILKRPNDYEATKAEYPLVCFSPSGSLIDELAYAADRWTEEDMYDNNLEWETECVGYVLKEYNYEAGLLEKLNGLQEKGAIYQPLAEREDYDKMIFTDAEEKRAYKKSGLLYGAWLALTLPDAFNHTLIKYTDDVKDAFWSDELDDIAPDLAKEKEKALDAFADDLRHTWLYGDRSSAGLIGALEKHHGAEVDYDEKKPDGYDTISFTYTIEDAHEKYCGCFEDLDEAGTCENLRADGVKDLEAYYKKRMIDGIYSDALNVYHKRREASEKRRKENAERKEREAQNAKDREAARIAKLSAMKRKK